MLRPLGVDEEERDSPCLPPGTETKNGANKRVVSVPRRGPDVSVGGGCVKLYPSLYLSLPLIARHIIRRLWLQSRASHPRLPPVPGSFRAQHPVGVTAPILEPGQS